MTEKPMIKSYVAKDTLQKAKKICKQENRTMSNLIETALIKYMQDKKDLQKEINNTDIC